MTSEFREWEPMTHILSRIPLKHQRGLFSTDVHITSGDVHNNYIVLGSNVAVIYLFKKVAGNLLDTYRCGKSNDAITSVVIRESLQVVIICGTEKGFVHIFQLPSILPGRCKDLKHFILPHLLKREVTSLALSSNCTRLFAGGADGSIIDASIDYDKSECIAESVIKENAAIVQLAYSRGLLLVSTYAQSVLYDCEQKVTVKVGTQERKSLGKFGGQFGDDEHKRSDTPVYVSRPGHRLWRCNTSGQVGTTLVFKELLEKAPDIPLAVPVSRLTDRTAMARGVGAFVDQFGQLLMLDATRIVTWNDDTVYVVDVAASVVLGVCRDVGPILSVFVGNDEIFLLRPGMQRRLIRIALTALTPIVTPATMRCEVSATGHIAVTSGEISTKHCVPLLDAPLLKDEQRTPEAVKKLKHVETTIQAGFESMKKSVIGGLGDLMKNSRRARSEDIGGGGSMSSIARVPVAFVDALAQQRESSFMNTFDGVSVDGDSGSLVRPTESRCGSSNSMMPAVNADTQEEQLVMHVPVGRDAKKAAVSPSQSCTVLKLTADACSKEEPCYPEYSNIETAERGGREKDGCAGDAAFTGLVTTLRFNENEPSQPSALLSVKDGLGSSRESLGSVEQASGSSKKLGKKANKKVKAPSSIELAAGQRFKALYDQLSKNIILDVPTVNYDQEGAEVSHNSADNLSFMPGTSDANVDVASEDVHSCAGRSHAADIPFLPSVVLANPPGASDDVPHSAVEAGGIVGSPTDDIDIYNMYRPRDFADVPGPAAAADGNIAGVVPVTQLPRAGSEGHSFLDPLCSSDHSLESVDSSQTDFSGPAFSRVAARSIWPIVSEEWIECSISKNVRCVAVSSAYVVYVDKDDAVHYSKVKERGILEWKKLDVTASCLGLSPAGDICWRLTGSSAFAGGCRMAGASLAHMKWTEAVRGGVVNVAVSDRAAWYIKEGGQLLVHEAVSKERPVTRAVPLKCDKPLAKVAGRGSTLWAQALFDQAVLWREGVNWRCVSVPGQHAITDFSLGCDGIAWVVDAGCDVWFAELAECAHDPANMRWWQVCCQPNLMPAQGQGSADKGPRLLPAADGGRSKSVLAAVDGVTLLCFDSKKIMHLRRGHVVGHSWVALSFAGIASSARWSLVFACDASCLWLVQGKQELICYDAAARRSRSVAPPDIGTAAILSVSGSLETCWALFEDGRVFVSVASRSDSRLGTTWAELDMLQLDGTKLVHLSVSQSCVWAVDSYGMVYSRIGALPKQSHHMIPAWTPVEKSAPLMSGRFTSVCVSLDGSCVWAIDSKCNVFARRGITDVLPIGVSWVQVVGSAVKQLVLSRDTAWALTPDGEIMCRGGISQDNVAGDFWRVLPGRQFSYICTSANNDLWAISVEGKVLKHSYKVIGRAPEQQLQQHERREPQVDAAEHDWELL